MHVTTGSISNFMALLITGALLTLWAMMPSASEPAGAGESVGEMTVALEAEPAPEPPPPAAAEPEKAEEAPKPPEPEPVPPPVPEPPPPPPAPEPPREPEKEEEAQPAEQMLDEDGAPITPPPQAMVEANEEQASAFKKCLLNRTYYPSTREARKLKPHGVVGLKILIIDAKVAGIEITQPSGSQILDQAARSSVLNSGCASKGQVSGIVVTTIRY
ncbi:periplasmic protein TonB [Hyphomicrobium sp. 1Nfss2.1]